MPDYDFTSLSSVDFESLVRDLLQKELKVTLESFKNGRDLGIDMRYSKNARRTFIVQCKHYAGSTFRKLLSDLRTKELPKVKRLNPLHYLLATSVGLTPPNKDALAKLFAPFCTSTGDIYGRTDLNNLLSKFPEVEQQHFKLWLTSIPVLEKVLHSEVFNQTEADLEEIQKKLRFYVQNKSFFEALKILDKEHYCIIAGIPGIGKTTLAEVLLVNYLDKGYEAITVTSNISEAFDVYKKSKKQVFYYDDFLGQTSLEEKLDKNEDRSLLRFINLVRGSKSTRFILTTREYILNQAKATYEKLSQSNFDVNRYVISLADYTRFDRAKILYNHVYFSGLPRAYKKALIENTNYRKIIDHQNFNPRIVEWMTAHVTDLEIKDGDYVAHFLANLDNPSRLWKHAFENQLSKAARHLLLVLASLPKEVLLDDLEVAFASHYEHSAKRHNFQTEPRDFTSALKELESNFVHTELKGARVVVTFHNPSVRDFLAYRLITYLTEVSTLCESACFYDQFIILWHLDNKPSKRNTKRKPIPSLLSRNPKLHDVFIKGMIRTFESENSRTEVVRYKADNSIVVLKPPYSSLAPRIQFALSVAHTLYQREAFVKLDFMLRPMFDKLLEGLKSGKGDKGSLVNLLQYIEGDWLRTGIEHGVIPGELVIEAKKFLMQDMQSLDEFKYFLEFRDIFKDAVTEEDQMFMSEEFFDFYPNEIEYNLDDADPDSLRWFASELDDVATAFNLIVDDEVERLREHANELERNAVVEEDLNQEYGYAYGGSGGAEAGGDIDSMFETLLE